MNQKEDVKKVVIEFGVLQLLCVKQTSKGKCSARSRGKKACKSSNCPYLNSKREWFSEERQTWLHHAQ